MQKASDAKAKDLRRTVMCKIKLEAAPRFELGVKLLQSLALPLGYAALLK
jgi:hypothetical protein